MLLEASLSERTRVIYSRQVTQYLEFTVLDARLARFGTESVKQFIAKLHLDRKSHATIASHVSALAFHCKRHDIPNGVGAQAVKAVLKGVRNLTPRNPNLSRGCVSFGQLKQLCAMARSHFGKYEAALVCCAFSLAFLGSCVLVSTRSHRLVTHYRLRVVLSRGAA